MNITMYQDRATGEGPLYCTLNSRQSSKQELIFISYQGYEIT